MKRLLICLIILLCMGINTLMMAESLWRDDFDNVENWYDNKTDESFRAVIVPGRKKGTAEVVQKGKGNWGKVAFVVMNVDIDTYNIIRVKVNKVSKSGDYKILAISKDWGESYVVIDRSKGKGIKEGNIKEATGWKGMQTFNIVVVVEGTKKKVVLDWIELGSKEEKKKKSPNT